MTTPTIVGIGEALWDTFPEGSHFGGAPGNFALHVASFGGHSHLVSAFGDDDLGEKARAFLTDRDVDITHVQTHPSRATGEVRITLNEEAIPQFHFMADPAWGDIISTPQHLALAARCNAVNFGTLGQSSPSSRATTQEFLRHCPANSIRLFDMNLRRDFWSPELILESLELASALKCNEDEILVLADVTNTVGNSPAELLHKIRNRYDLHYIAHTQGAQGSLLLTADFEDHQAPCAIKAIDTTGAGDSFIATLITGILSGIPLEAVHRHAAKVAAYVCTQQGAAPSLPDELRSFR